MARESGLLSHLQDDDDDEYPRIGYKLNSYQNNFFQKIYEMLTFRTPVFTFSTKICIFSIFNVASRTLASTNCSLIGCHVGIQQFPGRRLQGSTFLFCEAPTVLKLQMDKINNLTFKNNLFLKESGFLKNFFWLLILKY